MKKYFVVIILSILLIGALGFIVYDKILKKEKTELKYDCPECKCDEETDKESNEVFDVTLSKIPSLLIDGKYSKKEIKPIKQLRYAGEKEEKVKIDDNLEVIFYDSTFDIIYKNKRYDVRKYHHDNCFTDFEFTAESETFDIYKLGDQYLIKAFSQIGQTDWDWLVLITEWGDIKWLRNEGGALSPGLLVKVEMLSANNQMPFYLLTVRWYPESDGPDTPVDGYIKYYVID